MTKAERIERRLLDLLRLQRAQTVERGLDFQAQYLAARGVKS